jgi:hypothetical protein
MLTTTRPTKKATAVDVASCFYYLLVSEEISYPEAEDSSRDVISGGREQPLQRPYPPTPSTDRPELEWRWPTGASENTPQNSNKPLFEDRSVHHKPLPPTPSLSSHAIGPSAVYSGPRYQSVQDRRPLGPRSLEIRPSNSQGLDIQASSIRYATQLSPRRDFHQTLHPGPISNPQSSPKKIPQSNPPRLSKPASRLPFRTTVLSIIRRDPSSNIQSNIGNIRIPVVESFSKWSKADTLPFKVDMTQSSYLQYDDNQSRVPYPTNDPFIREVTLESLDLSGLLNGHRREHSESSLNSGSHSSDVSSGNEHEHNRKRTSKAKTYRFSGLRGEACVFETGRAGRNIKCYTSTSSQPESVQYLSTAREAQLKSQLSELRFNLPLISGTSTSSALTSPQLSPTRSSFLNLRAKWHARKKPADDVKGHSRSKSASELWFAAALDTAPSAIEDKNQYPYHNPSLPSSPQKEEFDNYVVGGGGLLGKDAKLGKIIVQREAFPMLDLIVAVNIGIWWRGWERSFK